MNAFSVQDLNSVTLEDGDNGPNKVSGETDHRENKERQCRNNLERFSVHDLFRRRLYNRHVRMGAFVRAGAHGPTELVKRSVSKDQIPLTCYCFYYIRTSMVSPSRREMTVPEKSAALIAETANNCNANGMRLHAWRSGRFLTYRPINGLRLAQ